MRIQFKRPSVLTSTEAQTELPQQREVKEKGRDREQNLRIGKGIA